MSHPFTDAYGYPLTAAAALRAMRSKGKRYVYTGAVLDDQTGGPPAITVHEAAEYEHRADTRTIEEKA